MKLKIIKDIVLANPEVYLSHWIFAKGTTLNTDNEYLIDRLLQLNVARILDKENNVATVVVGKESKAILEKHANKMFKFAPEEIKFKPITEKIKLKKTIRGKKDV